MLRVKGACLSTGMARLLLRPLRDTRRSEGDRHTPGGGAWCRPAHLASSTPGGKNALTCSTFSLAHMYSRDGAEHG